MKKQAKPGFQAAHVGDYVSKLLSPVIEQRAGMTMDLIASWEEIVGEDHAKHSRPQKLNWPRRPTDDDAFEPATLVIACEGAQSLFLMHDSAAIIGRINTYFGFGAVSRLKLVQKPLNTKEPKRRKVKPQIKPEQARRLKSMLENVEDPQLRESLEKMGRGVFSSGSGEV